MQTGRFPCGNAGDIGYFQIGQDAESVRTFIIAGKGGNGIWYKEGCRLILCRIGVCDGANDHYKKR